MNWNAIFRQGAVVVLRLQSEDLRHKILLNCDIKTLFYIIFEMSLEIIFLKYNFI